MYHNTYVAEQVAARDRVERERLAEQADMAAQLLQSSVEQIGLPTQIRSMWVVRGVYNWLVEARNILSTVASRRSHSR
jgi:hypothetical protein